MLPVLFFIGLEVGLEKIGIGYPTRFALIREINGQEAYVDNPRFFWQFFPPRMARTCDPFVVPVQKHPSTYRIFLLGASIVRGDPDPAFSFGRILEVMLEERFPEIRFEFVNTGATAINSHVVRKIIWECTDMEPDLFVVYIGNNEVVGPFGAGTIFSPLSPSLLSIRAGLAVEASRTGQLLDRILRFGAVGRNDREWGGLEMFLHKRVRSNDPHLEDVCHNYVRNLEDICGAARKSGTELVIATPSCNLRHCAPFASLHPPDFNESDLRRWNEVYQAGIVHEGAGDYQAAIERYREAETIDETFANLHFRLGRCYWAINEFEAAKERFSRACDLDVLRFRIDSRMDQLVRSVAEAKTGEGVYLADTAGAIAAASPHGVPGEEFFYDHAHSNFDGSYLIAKELFGRIAYLLTRQKKMPADNNEIQPPSKKRCAELLAYTGWNQYEMALWAVRITSRPPFTNQFDHQEQQARHRRQIADKAAYVRPDALDRAAEVYRRAIERDPGDLHLRRHFAALQNKRRDYVDAIRHWTVYLDAFSDDAEAHLGYGQALVNVGRVDEGVEHYRLATRSQAQAPSAHYNWALALARQNKLEQAVVHYREAIRLKPDHVKARNNLGLALKKQGRPDEAITEFTEAVRFAPRMLAARHNLATSLLLRHRFEEAAVQIEQLVRLRPDEPNTRALLASTYLELGKLDDAIQQFSEALRLNPNFAEAHNGLGIALTRDGQPAEAIDHFSEALRIKPNWPEARENLRTAKADLERRNR